MTLLAHEPLDLSPAHPAKDWSLMNRINQKDRQVRGQERHPTFYLYRQQEKAYHIDYCFGSADIVKRLVSVEVGSHVDWMMWSDHLPVVVTLNAF